MFKASIDIGSNTALLLIAEYDGDKLVEHESESIVTALGKDLDQNKMFRPESMNDTFLALSRYADLIKKYEIPLEQVVVTATEASRVAKNAPALYEKVRQDLGLGVKIISSEGEAYYTAMGVCLNLTSGDYATKETVLMDVGGASTELIRVRPKPFKYLSSLSLPMGSVRATQWRESDSFEHHISHLFQSEDQLLSYKTKKIICVAGTMTALGGMIKGLSHFEAKEINGQKISYRDFKNFVQKIEKDSIDKILEHYPFLGKRVESIVGGAWVACRLIEKLDVEFLEVSTRGLRHGTLMSERGIDQRFVTGEY